MRRTPFLLGRISDKASEIVLVDPSVGGPIRPIPGPWNLQALTRPRRILRVVRD